MLRCHKTLLFSRQRQQEIHKRSTRPQKRSTLNLTILFSSAESVHKHTDDRTERAEDLRACADTTCTDATADWQAQPARHAEQAITHADRQPTGQPNCNLGQASEPPWNALKQLVSFRTKHSTTSQRRANEPTANHQQQTDQHSRQKAYKEKLHKRNGEPHTTTNLTPERTSSHNNGATTEQQRSNSEAATATSQRRKEGRKER